MAAFERIQLKQLNLRIMADFLKTLAGIFALLQQKFGNVVGDMSFKRAFL